MDLGCLFLRQTRFMFGKFGDETEIKRGVTLLALKSIISISEGGDVELQTGMRIIYDQDGEIVLSFMLSDGSPRKEITKLEHIDLNYDNIDLDIYRIVKINPETKTPIIERIHPELTPEEKMRELEDQLLLLVNENTGGIL